MIDAIPCNILLNWGRRRVIRWIWLLPSHHLNKKQLIAAYMDWRHRGRPTPDHCVVKPPEPPPEPTPPPPEPEPPEPEPPPEEPPPEPEPPEEPEPEPEPPPAQPLPPPPEPPPEVAPPPPKEEDKTEGVYARIGLTADIIEQATGERSRT